MGERTGWRGQNESHIGEEEKRSGTFVCCQDQQRACRMAQASAEKLEDTGPDEKKKVVSISQRAVGKYHRFVFAKRDRNRAVSPEHQI